MHKRLLSWLLILVLLFGAARIEAPLQTSAASEADLSLEMYNNFLLVDSSLFLYDAGQYLKDAYEYTDAQVSSLSALAQQVAFGCTAPQDKVFAVMRYFAVNIGYDMDYFVHKTQPYPPRDPIAVLNNRYAVCAGYAECTEVFLQMLGVPCITVHSPDHAWNIAFIGDRWMLLDTTWISYSRYEHGVLNLSDRLDLSWYDFSIQQANAQENHVILSMPYMQYNGVLYNFPSRSKLTSFTVPDTVTCLGEYLFSWNYNLQDITIPNSVTRIEKGAFYNCVNLKQVTLGNGVTHIGDEAFAFCSSLEELVLPDSTNHIGDKAFYLCESAKRIALGNGVTYIGDEAFAFCHGLEEMALPHSVTYIGNKAFSTCENIKRITLGDGVTHMGDEAFAFCSSLEEMTLPTGITQIGAKTFYACKSIKRITLGNAVTHIEEGAFSFCNALEKMVLPHSVTHLGSRAFFVCPLLSYITLPDGVTTLESDVFSTYCADTTIYGRADHPLRSAIEALGLDYAAQHSSGYRYGDVDKNGTVNSTDARLVLQYAVGKIGDSALFLATADVNGDGTINSTDARLILQFAVGKIHSF